MNMVYNLPIQIKSDSSETKCDNTVSDNKITDKNFIIIIIYR